MKATIKMKVMIDIIIFTVQFQLVVTQPNANGWGEGATPRDKGSKGSGKGHGFTSSFESFPGIFLVMIFISLALKIEYVKFLSMQMLV